MPANKLHPRNKHQGQYHFDELVKANPPLEPFIVLNPKGEKTINFHNADAVKELNRALLLNSYPLQYWDIPDNNLCPPIPGRADYIHHLADLLGDCHSASNKIPKGKNILGLDIGTGANLIYPIVGNQEYGWQFIGSDIDDKSLKIAEQNISKNKALHSKISLRKQNNSNHIFDGIIQPDDFIDFAMCNPPFHSSKEEALKGTQRKLKNLGKTTSKTSLNFSGSSNELWCPGGEWSFIKKMIKESVHFQKQCMWFTTLVSKQSNVRNIQEFLKTVKPTTVKVVEMGQGNKTSRFIAWSFFTPTQQKKWVAAKW